MPDLPILVFPKPNPVDKRRGHGGGTPPPRPTNQIGQAQRIENQFKQILWAFVTDEPGDIERVLVMETSHRIEDLQNAVKLIHGLEWLAEIDVHDIELHDLYDEVEGRKIKGGRFYVLSSNKQAVDQLLQLWKQYKANKKLEHGYGKFADLFKFLITLRRWEVRDRLRDTGILEDWRNEYESKQGTGSVVNFEIELHYRLSESTGNKSQQAVQQMIEHAGGSIGKVVRIDEIAFHAMKAKLPVASIEKIVRHNWNSPDLPIDCPPVFNSNAVRYFRPTGQHIDAGRDLPKHLFSGELNAVNEEPPVLALLDGAPMLRHRMLDGRITLYDPDGYESAYAPQQQKHGTAMASLMCHGGMGKLQTGIRSLERRIYVRPVMRPVEPNQDEGIPADIFQEDLIERAVREMFEGEGQTAPSVRAINLSLGNIDQHYINEMSPWARLLDWLAFKYKVLFIISAGNFNGNIDLIDSNGDNEQRKVLRSIDKNQRNHRLLAPAESINALTVGALQSDWCGDLTNSKPGFDPINDAMLPAPYSRIGPGHRVAIKPEIFVQGGRLLYEQVKAQNSIKPNFNNEPPGIKVAYPGAMPEQLNNTVYGVGTSHAAALASHGAGHIFEMLTSIHSEHEEMPTEIQAVLIKAMLVHSASWGENHKAYGHLTDQIGRKMPNRYISRHIGYGNINIERVLECTRTRATAVGSGSIRRGERYRFVFPLPAGGSIQDYLRLTVTLAWFSPVNPRNIAWRKAKLFFEGDGLTGKHGHQRQEADWQQVKKGTVQHEIFELTRDNIAGDSLELCVQCSEDAGVLDDAIPYGLAVTLEIAENEAVNLYQEVRNRIRQPVKPVGA